MIDELKAGEIEEILKTSPGSDPLPRYEDSQAWERLTQNPMLRTSPQQVVKRARGMLDGPLSLIPASIYLSYRRTGSRTHHDAVHARRRSHLEAFVLAECIERKGTFLDPIMDHIWAICEESSWVIPAHSRTPLPSVQEITWVDLVASRTALVFGQTMHILGRRLEDHQSMVVERMAQELRRRCWDPYLSGKDLAWLFSTGGKDVNNWNAVCNCGVVGSALLTLEDTAMLSRMVGTCLRSLNDYLASFDADGGSSEGPSYWRYGVSHYVWLSYLLEMRTNGRISLLRVPEMEGIARFPQRVTLSRDFVVNFADCAPRVRFPPSLMYHLGKELGLPDVSAFAQYQYDMEEGAGSYDLRDLVWMPRESGLPDWQRESCFFFSGQNWWISRAEPANPDCMIVAAKGGHNGENHNQNDLGNFLVHFGGETLIVDLGAGSYTREYFGPGRYDILVNNSWGHNVPLINGYQQGAGAGYRARVIKHGCGGNRDHLRLDLLDAYPPESGLASLEREITLTRGEERGARVQDRFLAKDKTCKYVLPLYTLGSVTYSGSRLVFDGESSSIAIEITPQGLEHQVEDVILQDPKLPETIRRVVLTLEPEGREGELTLDISEP